MTAAADQHRFRPTEETPKNGPGLTGGPSTDKGICDLHGELSELTVPEIRHLVTCLVWHLSPNPNQVLH